MSLAKFLHLSPCVESLDLRGNQISDVGATALAEALLSSFSRTDEASSSSLRSLHLGYNRVGDKGARALSTVLKDSRCRLERLDLSCNGIEDVTKLTHALQQNNRTLTHLNLFGNPLTSSATLYQDFLHVVRDYNNDVLQVIKLPADGRASQQHPQKHLRHWLCLNKAGRRVLPSQHSLPMGAWAHVLDVKRQTPETLFYFTTQLPHLFR
jgi:Leucine-rich repeat (LRR) protein